MGSDRELLNDEEEKEDEPQDDALALANPPVTFFTAAMTVGTVSIDQILDVANVVTFYLAGQWMFASVIVFCLIGSGLWQVIEARTSLNPFVKNHAVFLGVFQLTLPVETAFQWWAGEGASQCMHRTRMWEIMCEGALPTLLSLISLCAAGFEQGIPALSPADTVLKVTSFMWGLHSAASGLTAALQFRVRRKLTPLETALAESKIGCHLHFLSLLSMQLCAYAVFHTAVGPPWVLVLLVCQSSLMLWTSWDAEITAWSVKISGFGYLASYLCTSIQMSIANPEAISTHKEGRRVWREPFMFTLFALAVIGGQMSNSDAFATHVLGEYAALVGAPGADRPPLEHVTIPNWHDGTLTMDGEFDFRLQLPLCGILISIGLSFLAVQILLLLCWKPNRLLRGPVIEAEGFDAAANYRLMDDPEYRDIAARISQFPTSGLTGAQTKERMLLANRMVEIRDRLHQEYGDEMGHQYEPIATFSQPVYSDEYYEALAELQDVGAKEMTEASMARMQELGMIIQKAMAAQQQQ